MAQRGWDYYRASKLDTAMLRFNQAWLLDSTNAQAYWGFANIVGKQGRSGEAIPLFEKALRLTPDDDELLVDAAAAYRDRYRRDGKKTDVRQSLDLLHRSIEPNPDRALAHWHTAVGRYYLGEYDTAWTSVHRAASLDPDVVVPAFVAALKQEKADPQGTF